MEKIPKNKSKEEETKPIALISLALGDIYDEKGEGKMRIGSDGKPDGSIKRLRSGLVKIYRDTGRKPDDIINISGFSKRSPREQVEERKVALSQQMDRWIKENRGSRNYKTNMEPLSWSTVNEIRLGIKKLQEKYGKDKPVKLYISSNYEHLPRIMFYTKIYLPKNYEIKFVGTNHRFSLKDSLLGEPLKIARDLIYYNKVRARLARQNK